MSASSSARAAGVGLLSGALFAVGLALSGMTDPAKVLGFLDVAGHWDPSLAFVMGGAVGVHFTYLRWQLRRSAASTNTSPISFSPSGIDARLLLGAGVFGVGWGMAGYCPGPALVAAAFGRSEGLLFLLAMLGSIALYGVFRRRVAAPFSLHEPV